MENLGLGIPKNVFANESFVSIIIQVIIFLAIACIVIRVITLYFKNMELKRDPVKNQAEIEGNTAKIEKTIKYFVKIGGIVFAIVLVVMIILSNYIEI